MLKGLVRRWLGLEGRGGLADVLNVKDSLVEGLRADVEAHATALQRIIPTLNRNTVAVDYHEEILNASPVIARTKKAIDARRLRDFQAAQAEAKAAAAAANTPAPADRGEGAESAEEMLTAPVADELAARRAVKETDVA